MKTTSQEKKTTLSEFSDILNYVIDNNIRLQENGKAPVAINIVGEKGIGKTSVIREIAESRGMGFTKLNVSQLDEVGDLIGLPIKELEATIYNPQKNEDGSIRYVPGENVWGTEMMFKTYPKKFRFTGKSRTSYAKPSWVPDYNENGNILLLDDHNRCQPIFQNAVMDLILEQKYVSWSLPKKTTIVLTNNPDNGAYNVNSVDEAQAGRYLSFEVGFDIDDWARWAESENIDNRMINFALTYGTELFSENEEGVSIADARCYVMFANVISGIPDWEKSSNLLFIYNIAKGCFHDDSNKFASMFTTFIRNRMHLMVSPKTMLEGKTETVLKELTNCIYDKTTDDNGDVSYVYRPDIASLLSKRFINYVNANLKTPAKIKSAVVRDRIIDFIKTRDTDKRLFTEDLLVRMVRDIVKANPKASTTILMNTEIAKLMN